jgi:hypothetical protein
MTKIIDFYGNIKTEELKKMLKKYEKISEKNEILIDMAKEANDNYDELKKENDDYEIDIRLIRMELNRRLWNGDY